MTGMINRHTLLFLAALLLYAACSGSQGASNGEGPDPDPDATETINMATEALAPIRVGQQMGVKASGGVRTLEDVQTMVAHGATRIGASASVAIMKGLVGGDGY